MHIHLFWKVCYNAVLLEALNCLQPYFSTNFICILVYYFKLLCKLRLFLCYFLSFLFLYLVNFWEFHTTYYFYPIHPQFLPLTSISSILTSLPPHLLSSFLFLVWTTSLTQNFAAYILLGVDHPTEHVLPTRGQPLPLEAINCQ